MTATPDHGATVGIAGLDDGNDADGDPRPGPARRRPITRERVLAAAIEVVDDTGLATFSVRQVADRFGVATMAMYHYIRGRDDLLDAAAEQLVDRLYLDSCSVADAATWQEYLAGVAQHVRSVALAHPQPLLLVVSRPTAAPWLRPPLANVAWMESFLEAMHRNGFDGAATLTAYRTFCRFLTGHLLNIAALAAPALRPSVSPPIIDVDSHPNLHTLRAQLTDDHAAEEFERSLTAVLDELAPWAFAE